MGFRKVSILEMAKSIKTPWTQMKLCSVENYDVKIAVYEGEYHRHIHTHHDEFIYILSGNVTVTFDDDEIKLEPGDGVLIPKGTAHKSRSDGRAEVLLFEKDTIMDDYVRADAE